MYALELDMLPEGKLLRSRNGDTVRYYQGERTDEGYDRKGITRNKELIKELARKEYLKQALPALDKNIAAVERAIKSYQPCDPESIVDKLSATYSDLPREYFYDPTVDKVMLALDRVDAKRIASHFEWGREPYEPPEYLPEGRTLITSRGDRMRSKAEVLIAEKLYEYGIPFRYEQPLEVDGATFHPDFTFEGAGGEPFYLEFCGMMDDPKYVASYRRKRDAYEAVGVTEWDNMIYVFARENEMNMMLVDAVIRTKIIPWL